MLATWVQKGRCGTQKVDVYRTGLDWAVFYVPANTVYSLYGRRFLQVITTQPTVSKYWRKKLQRKPQKMQTTKYTHNYIIVHAKKVHIQPITSPLVYTNMGWLGVSEQCFTSPPTQYRLLGDGFYSSNDRTKSVKVPVMGESESRLGFKSRFEHFLGMIRQILGLIRHKRLGFDSIRYFLWFDSKRGIRQPNLSQLSVWMPQQ